MNGTAVVVVVKIVVCGISEETVNKIPIPLISE